MNLNPLRSRCSYTWHPALLASALSRLRGGFYARQIREGLAGSLVRETR